VLNRFGVLRGSGLTDLLIEVRIHLLLGAAVKECLRDEPLEELHVPILDSVRLIAVPHVHVIQMRSSSTRTASRLPHY
jgi:hypothetical protein